MNKLDLEQNCPLTLYLQEVSSEDRNHSKAQAAGVLLYGLVYPHFIQKLPVTASLVSHISETWQPKLMTEAADKCAHCPQLGNCEVGNLVYAE